MKILVCTDGEPHSEKAVHEALRMARKTGASITALYVIDPWLKQFAGEIYAQGRREYLEYVDDCLRAAAETVREAFFAACEEAGTAAGFLIRRGEPEEEIITELAQSGPDLLITGGKRLNAWGRFRSRNLPSRLERRVGSRVPQMSVIASG